MLQTQRTQAQKLQGIAIDMDEEVLRQLLLEEKLTIDHFRCVDTESKHAIRKLFLWVLDQRLNTNASPRLARSSPQLMP